MLRIRQLFLRPHGSTHRPHSSHCVRQELPRLAEMALKLAATRDDRAPELAKVAELIEQLRGECIRIFKEEQVLFPFISQMDQESIVAYPPRTHASFGYAPDLHDGTRKKHSPATIWPSSAA